MLTNTVEIPVAATRIICPICANPIVSKIAPIPARTLGSIEEAIYAISKARAEADEFAVAAHLLSRHRVRLRAYRVTGWAPILNRKWIVR